MLRHAGKAISSGPRFCFYVSAKISSAVLEAETLDLTWLDMWMIDNVMCPCCLATGLCSRQCREKRLVEGENRGRSVLSCLRVCLVFCADRWLVGGGISAGEPYDLVLVR
ncbi:hypothetical protein Tco_0764903 [Tanacetum coccineum]